METASPAADRAGRSRPVGKELRATLDGKAAAVARLAARTAQYDGPHIQQRLALTDGADALQRAMQAALPHLDRERWFAVVFRPMGQRLTTSEARRAGGEQR